MLKGIYWIGFIVSVLICAAFLIWNASWFWVMLPFIGTFFVKALDWI